MCSLTRCRGVVPRQSHKLETPVQFGAPQHVAGVAQWLEQLHHKQKVTGSNPVTGTGTGDVAQLVRARDCRSRGCEFESRRPRKIR